MKVISHELYMQRCLELAQKGKGLVSPNPLVGCVIVHNNQIIGEGYHHQYGGPHAEVNAIHSVQQIQLLPESTLYVNLEPCSHHGKTPPCSDLILTKKIKKVVVGSLDSNPLVAGKGLEKLKMEGVEVISGIMEKECRYVNQHFYTFFEKKRPFYTLKWAESRDGFIYSSQANSQLSNALSMQRVHQLRAENRAILIGKNTLLTDNPSLTTRLVVGKNPLRIIVVNQLLPAFWQTKIFTDGLPTLVFNTEKSGIEKHLEFIQYTSPELLKTLNQQLFQRQINSVLVEGGTKILQQFINAQLWDEIIQIKTPVLLNSGIMAPNFGGHNSRKNEQVDSDKWNYFTA